MGWSWDVLRASQAGEDLAPLRKVPVAERRAGDVAACGPGAAAEHLVAVAEEDLGVLRVGERLKARIGEEVGRGPLPHVAEHVNRAAVRGAIRMGSDARASERHLVEVRGTGVSAPGGRLPLVLGGQSLPGPAREGVGLV